MVRRQRREQQSDIYDMVRHVVLPEDVPSDDPRMLGRSHISYALRENGIAIVCPAVSGQESNEALSRTDQ